MMKQYNVAYDCGAIDRNLKVYKLEIERYTPEGQCRVQKNRMYTKV